MGPKWKLKVTFHSMFVQLTLLCTTEIRDYEMFFTDQFWFIYQTQLYISMTVERSNTITWLLGVAVDELFLSDQDMTVSVGNCQTKFWQTALWAVADWTLKQNLERKASVTMYHPESISDYWIQVALLCLWSLILFVCGLWPIWPNDDNPRRR